MKDTFCYTNALGNTCLPPKEDNFSIMDNIIRCFIALQHLKRARFKAVLILLDLDNEFEVSLFIIRGDWCVWSGRSPSILALRYLERGREGGGGGGKEGEGEGRRGRGREKGWCIGEERRGEGGREEELKCPYSMTVPYSDGGL